MSEGFMYNGKPNGYWKTYYPNGNLKSEGNRKSFVLDSIWTFYNSDSSVKEKITYVNGKKDGLSHSFLNDKIHIETPFKSNIISGTLKEYFTNETLKKELNYLNGELHGDGYEYDKDGNIITIYKYKSGVLNKRLVINRFNMYDKKQGIWISFYPDKVFKSKGFYNDGLKDGYFRFFGPDGKLLYIEKYINGVLDKKNREVSKIKTSKEFYPNMSVKRKSNLINGNLDGIQREYDERGIVKKSFVYENGILIQEGGIIDDNGLKNGFWKYYKNDKLNSCGNYVNGQKQGIWKYYYPNGVLEQEENFLDGKLDGEKIWYYRDSKLLRKENYKNGKRHGLFIEYNTMGIISVSGNYTSGLKSGKWESSINDYTEIYNYQYGLKHGEYLNINKDGKVLLKKEYKDDTLDGKFEYYHANGNIKEKGEYMRGNRYGNWIFYNEDGLEIISVFYEGGLERSYNDINIFK
ncbi:toxin-antitoxin system YwqK family antitoxin [Ichthyobacterium seriolicida]|nr:hypothetical protein [Ichthyobacterium seriolicida]